MREALCMVTWNRHHDEESPHYAVDSESYHTAAEKPGPLYECEHLRF